MSSSLSPFVVLIIRIGSGPKVLMLYFSRSPRLSRIETRNQYAMNMPIAMLVPLKEILREYEMILSIVEFEYNQFEYN